MKGLFLGGLLLAASLPTIADAQVRVRGHYRSDGTYVAPHYRSAPDGNPYNNYSTRGNTNPYTGQPGTKDPARDQARTDPSAPRCYYNCPK